MVRTAWALATAFAVALIVLAVVVVTENTTSAAGCNYGCSTVEYNTCTGGPDNTCSMPCQLLGGCSGGETDYTGNGSNQWIAGQDQVILSNVVCTTYQFCVVTNTNFGDSCNPILGGCFPGGTHQPCDECDLAPAQPKTYAGFCKDQGCPGS